MQAAPAAGVLVSQTDSLRVLFLFRQRVLRPGNWWEVAAAAAVAMVYSRPAAIISTRWLNDSTQRGFRPVIAVSKLYAVLYNKLVTSEIHKMRLEEALNMCTGVIKSSW